MGNGISMCMGNGCGLRVMGNRYWIRVWVWARAWRGHGVACIDKLVKTRQGQGMDTCMCNVYGLARFPGGSFAQQLHVVSNCSGCGKLGVIRHCSITCVYFAVGVRIYQTRFNLACTWVSSQAPRKHLVVTEHEAPPASGIMTPIHYQNYYLDNYMHSTVKI